MKNATWRPHPLHIHLVSPSLDEISLLLSEWVKHFWAETLLAVAVGIRKAWMLKTNLQWGTQRERVRLGCGVIVVATVPLGSWLRSGSQWSNEDHALLRFLLLDSFCASQLEREIWSMLMSGSGYSYTCGEKRGKCKQSLMYSMLIHSTSTITTLFWLS